MSNLTRVHGSVHIEERADKGKDNTEERAKFWGDTSEIQALGGKSWRLLNTFERDQVLVAARWAVKSSAPLYELIFF